MNEVPTSAIPFVETEHGRMRREQRGIHMRDLQSAMKYGSKLLAYLSSCINHIWSIDSNFLVLKRV